LQKATGQSYFILLKKINMKKILVRYKVKADKVAENELLVKEVYKQLHETNIAGFHYTTLKLADGVSFVHIAFADTEEANTAFSNLAAFKKFQANIKDRCEEQPVVSAVTEIGSYNLYS
jgi:quinol monooxygenase YgiN